MNRPLTEHEAYYEFQEEDASNIIKALTEGLSYNMWEAGEYDALGISIDHNGIRIKILN